MKQEKAKERLRVTWDRWQSTDKGRGKEQEQKEKSSMMQTCDKKLQSEEKQQSPSAEGVSQQCRQCICASPRPHAESQEEIPGGKRTQQPPDEGVPRAQVQPQSLQLLGALRKEQQGRAPAFLPRGTAGHGLKGRLGKLHRSSIASNPLKIPHPPGQGKS